MNTDDIADRNVEQLGFTRNTLGRRPAPGSRPDGGMERVDPLQHTHDMVQKILETETNLRHQLEDARGVIDKLHDDISKLGAALDGTQARAASENEARVYLEGILRQIADLVVNGHKGQKT